MVLPTPYYADDTITIYNGDCVDLLPEIKRARVVLTDPPYVFGIASTAMEGKAGGWGDLMNSAHFYANLLHEFRRITEQDKGCAWVFNSWRSFPVLARASFEARWSIESLAVWDKQWIGPGGNRGLRPSYELCALFAHADFAIRDRGVSDIWPAKWASHKPTGHPAEKPLPFLEKAIDKSGGGLILDPFMGSGRTLIAAANLGMPAIGIEIEERWCERAARDVEAAKARGEALILEFGEAGYQPRPHHALQEDWPRTCFG